MPIVAVKRIPNDRMSDGRQMDADLMRHAGFHRRFRVELNPSDFPIAFDNASRPSSFCFLHPQRLGNGAHSPFVARIMGQRQIDHALCAGAIPQTKRPINLS